MDINNLQRLMLKYGAVIKTIPEMHTNCIETRHAQDPVLNLISAKVEYREEFKRDMLVITQRNTLGGKFLLAFDQTQDTTVKFDKELIFDSIEQIYNYLVDKDANSVKYDIVIKEKELDCGYNNTEFYEIMNMLASSEFIPIEIEGYYSVVNGFVTTKTAEALNYDFKSLKSEITKILNDTDLETPDNTYLFQNNAIIPYTNTKPGTVISIKLLR